MRVLAWPAFRSRRENPYNWLLYTALQRMGVVVDEFSPWRLLLGRYDIWHVHWLGFYLNRRSLSIALFRMVALLLLQRFARALGTRVVWTVHNLGTHDLKYPRLEAWFWRHWTAAVDCWLTLNDSGRSGIEERYPNLRHRPSFLARLGEYRSAYPAAPSRGAARVALGLPADLPVICSVGQVQAYKRVPQLIRTFRVSGVRARLIVAGSPGSPALAADVMVAAEDDPAVHLLLRHISDGDLACVLAASDLMYLPYASVLNSSSAMLALSFDRPVLVPKAPAMTELRRLVGRSWVWCAADPLAPYELECALRWATESGRPAVAPMEAFGWDEIAAHTLVAFEAVS